ncbi:lytic transglycosylase domain-containing protein [Alloiococcus sp. CFN-8]|uniref:lytic transglycosylase domain-containing protein n=1 Tax=Alloiococcus sp. CFN-8 TaxID=3416081 RepID=UPI003CE7FEF7
MKFVGRQLLRLTLVILIFILGIIALQYVFYVKLYPYKYEASLSKYSLESSIEDLLILSVIKAESKFDEKALSNKSAYGLMQITEPTAKEIAEQLGIKDFHIDMLFDADINIRMGSYYLSTLINEFEDLETAIAAYNSGLGNVNRWLTDDKYSKDKITLYNIPFKETDRYVKKVRVNYNMYNFLYKELPSYIPKELLIFNKN